MKSSEMEVNARNQRDRESVGGQKGGDEQLEDKMSRCGNECGRIINLRKRESDVIVFKSLR